MENPIKQSKLYKWLVELYIWNVERKRFLSEASANAEDEDKKCLKDYKKDFYKYRMSYPEYKLFRFSTLSEAQKRTFVSVAEMQCIYRRMVLPEVRHLFCRKDVFLSKFPEYIHRKWLLVSADTDYDEFVDFVSSKDVILKKCTGTRGEGIRKVCSKDITDVRGLYEECVREGLLVEECVTGYHDMQKFHPASLNTLRIVTFKINDKPRVICAFFLTGLGRQCINNMHAGGILCGVNTESGVVESDGYDLYGHEYLCHPESKERFMGFRIPQWDKCIDVCRNAMMKYGNVRVVGWDVCVTENGEVEIIEGNHAPDIDLIQVIYGGCRGMLREILKEYNIRL